MPISPARVAAYEILLRVERDRAFSSVLLPQYESGLSTKDAPLCHQIVLGVLRRKLSLDFRIGEFRRGKKIDLEVLTALRIGAYQLLELDRIPAHSAVNESVALVQRAKKTSAKGMVNAVLRRISEKKGETFSQDIGIELSHPQWLIDRWTEQFGVERAMSIAAANNSPTRSSFRITGKGDVELDGAIKSEIVDGAFTVERVTERLRHLSEKGLIYFQDEASQMIANLVSVPAGGRFLDVCAAPGGKTSQIAIRYRESGVSVVAGDLYQPRVEFLRSNCDWQGADNVLVVRYNAEAELPFDEQSFDAVMVDAPCTGTGTIASNPEIRYFLSPNDIDELSRKQLSILNNASKLVKVGGRLYYSTCSLEREENEDIVSAFLRESDDFKVVSEEIGVRFLTDEGFGRTFPDRDRTDGFFFASFERR